jgi:hypothetical protein
MSTVNTLTLEQTRAVKVPEGHKPISRLFAAVIALIVVFLLVVSTAFIVATTYSPFIYFRF